MKPIKEATLAEVCEGLRAQVHGLIPVKPAVPSGESVVRLPRATKEDVVQQESRNWEKKLERWRQKNPLLADGTTWPERLAKAELSVEAPLVDTFKCAVEVEGTVWRANDSLDVPCGVNPDACFDDWEDGVAADMESVGPPLVEQLSSQSETVPQFRQMAVEQLLELLSQHLTVTELTALKDRANGWRVNSRQTLLRARRKAMKILA